MQWSALVGKLADECINGVSQAAKLFRSGCWTPGQARHLDFASPYLFDGYGLGSLRELPRVPSAQATLALQILF
jgi:hypothetical protein